MIVSIAALTAALTFFYLVHEDLPRALRAPSALLLAPVAIASGLAHLAGRADVYSNLSIVAAVNLAVSTALITLGAWAWGDWKRRRRG